MWTDKAYKEAIQKAKDETEKIWIKCVQDNNEEAKKERETPRDPTPA